jgi:hypothetical protein
MGGCDPGRIPGSPGTLADPATSLSAGTWTIECAARFYRRWLPKAFCVNVPTAGSSGPSVVGSGTTDPPCPFDANPSCSLACYDRGVRCRVSPVALGIVLALVAFRPVLLDHCLLACSGESATITPSCHHATEQSGTRFETPSHACGHDHGAVLVAANASASHEPTSASAEAVRVDDGIIASSRSDFSLHSPPEFASGTTHFAPTPLRL